MQVGKARLFLHCIGKKNGQWLSLDYNTRELLGRWLIRVDMEMPHITYKYNIKAPIGEVAKTGMVFCNSTAQEHSYIFTASHPEIVNIVQNTFTLKPADKIQVPLILKAMDKPKQAQILIFAQEEDSGKHEAMVFTISYVL